MNVRRKALSVLVITIFSLTGCGRTKDLENLNRGQARVIAELHQQVGELQADLDWLKESKEELVRAKEELEKKLKEELAGGYLSVAMGERGGGYSFRSSSF